MSDDMSYCIRYKAKCDCVRTTNHYQTATCTMVKTCYVGCGPPSHNWNPDDGHVDVG